MKILNNTSINGGLNVSSSGTFLGNVGIGTTPVTSSLLKIADNTNARITLNRNGNWAAGVADVRFSTDSSDADVWTLGLQANSTNNFYLRKNSTNVITVIESTGNITFSANLKLPAVNSTGSVAEFNASGGVYLAGLSGSSYASLQAYSDGAGTGKILALNPAGGNVGIRTISPNSSSILHLVAPQDAYRDVFLEHNGSSRCDYSLARSKGTPSAKTALVAGDTIGYFRSLGYDGSQYRNASNICFLVDPLGTVSASSMPGCIAFSTQPDGGNASAVERMRITAAGNVGIGTTNPLVPLQINAANGNVGIGGTGLGAATNFGLYISPSNTANIEAAGGASQIALITGSLGRLIVPSTGIVSMPYGLTTASTTGSLCVAGATDNGVDKVNVTGSVYAQKYKVQAGGVNALTFWGAADSTTFAISMADATDATYGGRITGDTTSDYNMYFNMSSGTNRGFVFRTNTSTRLFAINPDFVRSNVPLNLAASLTVAGSTYLGALSATTLSYGSAINGSFGTNQYFIGELNDILYRANTRFTCTAVSGFAGDFSGIFRGNYDVGYSLAASATHILNINLINQSGVNASGLTYPGGYVYVTFYYNSNQYGSTGMRFKLNGIWASAGPPTNIAHTSGTYKVLQFTVPGGNYLSDIEFTIETLTASVSLGPIKYLVTRSDWQTEMPVLSKYYPNSLHDALRFKTSGAATNQHLIDPLGTSYFNSTAGNLSIGKSTDDGVNKLQVNGGVNISGNLGLGIVSPTAKLEVGGSVVVGGQSISGANAASVHISSGTSTSTASVKFGYWSSTFNAVLWDLKLTPNTGTMAFAYMGTGSEAASSSMYLTNLGRLGLGRNSPGEILELYRPSSGQVAISIIQSGQAAMMIGNKDSDTNAYWSNTYNTTTDFGVGAKSITLTNAGFVGIGTVAPTARLEVMVPTGQTQTKIRLSAADSTAYFTDIINNVNASTSFEIQSNGQTILKSSYQGFNAITIGNSNATLVVQPASSSSYFTGAVGIGISPVDAFHVTSNSTFTAIRLGNLLTGGKNYQIYTTSDSHSYGGGHLGIWDVTAGAHKLFFNSNGNIGFGNNTPGNLIGGFSVSAYPTIHMKSASRSYFVLSGGAASYPIFMMENQTGTVGQRAMQNYFSSDALSWQFFNEANGAVVSTPLTLLTSGNVGINNSNPSAGILDILGLTNSNANIRLRTASTGYDSQLFLDTFDNTHTSSESLVGFQHGGTSKAMLYTSAGATANDLQIRVQLGGVNFWTNGTPDRMQITAAGNVGIGNIAASSIGGKLHVYDSAQGHIIADSATGGNSQFRLYKAGALKWAMYSPNSSDDLRFYNNADRLIINSTGYVGIATTASPVTQLQVLSPYGNGVSIGPLSGNPFGTNDLGLDVFDGTAHSMFGLNKAGTLRGRVGTITAHQFAICTNNSDAITVLSDGKVGIGTASAIAKLSIVDSTTTDEEQFTIGINPTYHLAMGHSSASNTISYIASVWNSDSARFDIRMKGKAAADAKLTVLGTGSVGIGTVAPNANLDVSTTTQFCSINMKAGALAADAKNWRFMIRGDQNTDLRIGTVNDAYSSGVDLFNFTRDGKFSISYTTANIITLGTGATSGVAAMYTAGTQIDFYTDSTNRAYSLTNASLLIRDSRQLAFANPAYSYISNTSGTAGDLKVFSNKQVTFEGGCNVGIGTVTPLYKLQVSDTGGAVYSAAIQKSDANTPLYVDHNASGTNPVFGHGPTLILKNTNSGVGTLSDIRFTSGLTNSGVQIGAVFQSATDSDFYVAVQGSGGSSQALTVKSNGNIGINNTNPSGAKLVVKSTLYTLPVLQLENEYAKFDFTSWHNNSDTLMLTNQAGHTKFVIAGGNNGEASILFSGSGARGEFKTDSSYNWFLNPNAQYGTGHLYLNNTSSGNVYVATGGGKVGIGTAIPTDLLHVAGRVSINQNNALIWRDASTNDTADILGVSDDVNNGYLAFRTRKAGVITEQVRITALGNVGIGTPTANINTKLTIGDPITPAQTTAKIYGGGANKSALISLFNAGNREGFIAQTTQGLYFGNTSGLADYNDATLAAGAIITIRETGLVGIGVTGADALLTVKAASGNNLRFGNVFTTGQSYVGISDSAPAGDGEYWLLSNSTAGSDRWLNAKSGGYLSFGIGGVQKASLNATSFNLVSGMTLTSPTISTASVDLTSATVTTTGATATTLVNLPAATYRAAKFIIQATCAASGFYHTTEILAVHNGASASHTEYASINIGGVVGQFDVTYSGGINLIVTPTTSTSTVFKVAVIAIDV